MALKSVQKLISDMRNGAMAAAYGNHSFEKRNGVCYFRYHGSPVCVYDQDNETVSYSSCGYEGASSTTRTVRSYQEMFRNVTAVDREQHTAMINNKRSDINNGR